MATPAEIRKRTLQELRATRKDMASAKFLLSLRGQPPKVKTSAAIKALQVELAILELENAALAEIRDKLIRNEVALKTGVRKLAKARRTLTKVKGMLSAVGKLLTTVAKIVNFLG